MITQEKEKNKIAENTKPTMNCEEEPRRRSAGSTEKRSALTSIARGEAGQGRGDDEQEGGVCASTFPHYVENYDCLAEEEGELEPPRLVIRGAQISTPPPHNQKTTIDWLAFTSDETIAITQEFLQILIPEALFFPQMRGWQGYKNHYSISHFGKNIGLLAYGGNNDRPYLSITGDGCRLIEEWHLVSHYLNVMENVKITRCDIAADFFFNEVNKEMVDKAYEEGKFKLPMSRNNPLWDPREPISGDGVPKGWTRYIGKRTSGKYLRIYHKGLEQYSKLDPETQEQFLKVWEEIEVAEKFKAPEQATFKNWVRAEIEYSSKNRELPLSIIEDRDKFFSGAYPFLQEILPMAEPIRPKTLPNNLETCKQITLGHMRNQYGSFATTMLMDGMCPLKFMREIVNGKISQRYIKEGGLKNLKPYDPDILKCECSQCK